MSDRFNALKIRPPPEASGNVLASPAAPNWAGAWDENLRLRAESNLRHRQDWLERGLINPDTGELTPQGRQAQAMIIAGGFGPADVGLAGGIAGLIKNYHGSPHLFPPTPKNPLGEFDISKMGTGEGNQAFGKGMYTAGAEGTSETYLGRDADWKYGNTTATKMYDQVHNSRLERGLDNEGWSKLNAQRGFWEKVVLGRAPRQIIEDAKANPGEYGANELAYINSLDPSKFERVGGHMYEVNLHAEPHEFLNWDKPISEQSPHVTAALEKTGQMEAARQYFQTNARRYPNGPTGEALHEYLRLANGTDSAPAQILQQVGIPGIRYLDAGSRGKGVQDLSAMTYGPIGSGPWGVHGEMDPKTATGWREFPTREEAAAHAETLQTHNHVTWTPEIMEIVRRFGIPGIITGGAAAAGTQQGE